MITTIPKKNDIRYNDILLLINCFLIQLIYGGILFIAFDASSWVADRVVDHGCFMIGNFKCDTMLFLSLLDNFKSQVTLTYLDLFYC
jgi:hypothetical protein